MIARYARELADEAARGERLLEFTSWPPSAEDLGRAAAVFARLRIALAVEAEVELEDEIRTCGGPV